MAANPFVGAQGSASRYNDDDQALEQAVRRSLEDQHHADLAHARRHASHNTTTLPGDVEDLVLMLNNEFAPLEDPLGDTAIYFGAPSMMPDQTPKEYIEVSKHFDRLYIVQSANLRLMGESSKFDKMLGPISVRAERKLRKLGVLQAPEAQRGGKFKYYIDLRPPSEDEEAVILITDLTCTKGVLSWHLAKEKYQLPVYSVLGRDDFSVAPEVLLSLPQVNRNPAAEASTDASSSDASQPPPPLPPQARPQKVEKVEILAPEYSQLRHWSAIERLLNAIEGNDPKLDSAPKVWTFFAVARYFGCARHERISGWITTWIYSGNNANFIQCNPEVAYRIGMGIESAELVRDAFSLLVGERALLEAYGEYNAQFMNPLKITVHRRVVQMLDDDERNRVDHAASSLVRRIRSIFRALCRDMEWLQLSSDYLKLHKLVGDTPEEIKIIEETKDLVQDYVRGRIYYVLCQDQTRLGELESNTPETASFRAGSEESYETTYNNLNQPMRMFTRTFWTALSHTNFDGGITNTSPEGTRGEARVTRYITALKAMYADDKVNGIKTIFRSKLDASIGSVNQILYSREAKANATVPEMTLPNTEPAPGNEQVHSRSPTHPGPGLHVTNGLDPESMDFSSLAIGTPAKHASDAAGFSALETQSPSKRRKVSIAGGVTQASLTQTSFQDSFERPADDIFPFDSTDQLLHPAVANEESEKQGFGMPDMQALPIRPKGLPILEIVRDRIKQWAAQSDGEAKTNVAASMSKVENSLALAEKGKEREQPLNPGYTIDDAGASSTLNSGSDAHKLPSAPTSAAPHTSDRTVKDDGLAVSGARYTRINRAKLLSSVTRHIVDVCEPILHPPHLYHSTGLLPTNLYDCLLCLDDDEFKYLPLWAGGNDDGTGGVYDDFPVPNLDAASETVEAFGPGRIRKAHDAPSDSDAATMAGYEEIGSSQAISTVGKASKQATDGTVTVISMASACDVSDTHSVVLVPGVSSLVSDEEHATVVTDDDDDDDDMEVEAPDFSDFGDRDDDFNDDTDEETINGDDAFETALSASLREHIAASTSDEELSGSDAEFDDAMDLASTTSLEKGKGKEKEETEAPPAHDSSGDDTDDEFQLV